jgi:hypothetical protein
MPFTRHQKPVNTPPGSPTALSSLQGVSPILLNRITMIKHFAVDPVEAIGATNSEILEMRLAAGLAYQCAKRTGNGILKKDPYPGTAVDSVEPYIRDLFV